MSKCRFYNTKQLALKKHQADKYHYSKYYKCICLIVNNLHINAQQLSILSIGKAQFLYLCITKHKLRLRSYPISSSLSVQISFIDLCTIASFCRRCIGFFGLFINNSRGRCSINTVLTHGDILCVAGDLEYISKVFKINSSQLIMNLYWFRNYQQISCTVVAI